MTDPDVSLHPLEGEDNMSADPADPVDEMTGVLLQVLSLNALRITSSRGGYVGGGQPHGTIDSDLLDIEAVARGLLARKVAEPSRSIEPRPGHLLVSEAELAELREAATEVADMAVRSSRPRSPMNEAGRRLKRALARQQEARER